MLTFTKWNSKPGSDSLSVVITKTFALSVPPLFVLVLFLVIVLVASVVGLLRFSFEDFKILTVIELGTSAIAPDKLLSNPSMPSPSLIAVRVTVCAVSPFVIFCASEDVSVFVVFDTVDTALPVA